MWRVILANMASFEAFVQHSSHALTGVVRIGTVGSMQPIYSPSQQINVLQALRAWAAFAVLVFHVLDKSQTLFGGIPPWLLFMNVVGPMGVDIFFVISGFIMMMTTASLAPNRASMRHFLWRRITRVLPMYWLVTTGVLLMVLVVPSVFRELQFDLKQIIASYLFVPVTNAMGHQSPLLGVGWTLNFEMYFYVIFSGALLLRARLAAIALFFGASVALGWWLAPTIPMLQLMTNPLLLEFVAGAAAAVLLRRYPHIPAWLGLVGLGWLVMSMQHAVTQTLLPLHYGLSIGVMIAVLASLERRGKLRVPRVFAALGDSSYALYLTHVFALAVVSRVWMHFVGSEQVTAFCVVAPLLILPVGHMVYRCVERPMTRALQRMKFTQP
jgi:exopolysaccharide production protein ExoZ